MKSGNLNFLKPSGPLQACNGNALPVLQVNITLSCTYRISKQYLPLRASIISTVFTYPMRTTYAALTTFLNSLSGEQGASRNDFIVWKHPAFNTVTVLFLKQKLEQIFREQNRKTVGQISRTVSFSRVRLRGLPHSTWGQGTILSSKWRVIIFYFKHCMKGNAHRVTHQRKNTTELHYIAVHHGTYYKTLNYVTVIGPSLHWIICSAHCTLLKLQN